MTIIWNNYYVSLSDKKNKLLICLLTKDLIKKVKIFRRGNLILEYIDTKINDTTFIREIGQNKYTYENNKLILLESIKKVNFIKSLKEATHKNNNILTLDVETYLDAQNKFIPYCICIYDGIKEYRYYLTDFNGEPDKMIIAAINSISRRKYNKHTIYAHNLSGFDGIFLIRILSNLGQITPIIHNGKIISIDFCSYKNNYVLRFRDSYLLLLASLSKLGDSFNVDIKKGSLNHSSINKDNLLFHKNDALNYCIQDCISLYQVISKFNKLIFDRFKMNINNYPTLPSLAFALFRTHYLKDTKIAQLSGKIYSDIKNSYTGGSTDMFIPEGNNLFCYDVNSLYPFIMKEFPLPVGIPTYFEGDIRNIKTDAFGIFYCNIIAPNNLEHPILQTHISVKTSSNQMTVSPLGQWNDWINYLEMDNAVKFGYKFEIIKGYTFDKGYPFKDFINDLYQIRLNYPKSDPLNYIAKIIMNSLYGRLTIWYG
jgi:hypothetical protein